MTVVQALVRFLNQQCASVDGKEVPSVKDAATIFGHGNVLGIGQAPEQGPGRLQVMQDCNEQGTAHVATGFAKQHRRQRIFAITSPIGPDVTNMVMAVATATANRIPLLLLPRGIYTCHQPDPVLQQIEQHHDLSISANDYFRLVFRYWDCVNRPEQLTSAVLSVVRTLIDPADIGTVTICLPQDVQGEAWDHPLSFLARRVHHIEHRPPDPQRLAQAHALISHKRRPLVVCSDGVRYSGAHEVLWELVEVLQLPFAETQAGKRTLVSDHSLNLDGVGVTDGVVTNQLAPQTDLAIDIDTRLTDSTTGSKALFSRPDVEFLLLSVAESDSLKLDAIMLIVDTRTSLTVLAHALKDYRSGWGEAIAHAKSAWHDEYCRLWERQRHPDDILGVAGHPDTQLMEYSETLDTYLTQTRVLGLVNQHIEGNAILMGAAGSLPGDLQHLWQVKTPDSYHLEYDYSCMGYEVAAAIGAKLAKPQQPVYAMVGNGLYVMLHSELQTAIQEGIKVTILLFDNASFGCINNLQMGYGMGNFGIESRCRNPKTDQPDRPSAKVDFAQNVESYGCRVRRVHNEKSPLVALEASHAHPGPTPLGIKVLPKTMTRDYASW